MMTFLILAVGLLLLIVGGDLLVRGAVAGAVKLNISPMIIGLTIVAFGTSAPELVVSVDAALLGSPDLAMGNVVGSNVANILLVLGLSSLIAVTRCDQPFGKRNASFLLAVTLAFVWLCTRGPLTIWHGAVLVALLVFFLAMSAFSSSDDSDDDDETAAMIEGAALLTARPLLLVGTLLLGLVLLPAGAHITVKSASAIAATFGVSERVIGLTIVALGTSLPEIVTTVIAAFRGQSGLALGNAIGSCVFNLLAILGITALIAPLPIPAGFFEVDVWMLVATAAIPLILIAARLDIGRGLGIAFLVGYVGYMASLFMVQEKRAAAMMMPGTVTGVQADG